MQNNYHAKNRYRNNNGRKNGYRGNGHGYNGQSGRGRRWIIKLGGVSCSVSVTAGAVIIWGKREWQGQEIQIEPRAYADTSCKLKSATFGFYGTGRCHARFDLVSEGEYFTTGGSISGFYWTDISVVAGRVSQIEK